MLGMRPKNPKRPARSGPLAVESRRLDSTFFKANRPEADVASLVTDTALAKTPREDRPPVQPTVERDPITDFAAEADRLGVPLGPTNNPARAEDIIRRVAEDALDLFGSTEAGVAYLSSKDIDGLGHTGLNLVAERGLPAVLMKLDELRFGFAG